MRLIWNEDKNYFQAELTSGELWNNDMEIVRAVGFKNTGPPEWIWYTTKASILNKLKDKKPKSGLVITEIALEKYKFFNTQEQRKHELKKVFNQEKREANKISFEETFIDSEIGVTCLYVKPIERVFVQTFIKPESPKERCLICDQPLYFYEGNLACLWCQKESENNA